MVLLPTAPPEGFTADDLPCLVEVVDARFELPYRASLRGPRFADVAAGPVHRHRRHRWSIDLFSPCVGFVNQWFNSP
jgi:hypothetical protein